MSEKQLPQLFIEQIKTLFPDDYTAFLDAVSLPPAVSIRLKKGVSTDVDDIVPWCKSGRYLSGRPQFTLDPLFHAGNYYVQEASSMFLLFALEKYASNDALVLDLCAAPGGKSTLISDFLNNDGFLISNEYVPQRANILAENILKWGNPNCAVTNASSQQFAKLKGVFDVVVVDAPCSGEGMFRKDDVAIDEWSLDNVRKCVDRQREILSNAWQCLAENGILIYSTCTFNDLENERNVEWLINEFDGEYLPLNPDDSWGVTVTDFGCRFLPHKVRGEGFFISVVRKKSECSTLNIKSIKQLPPSCKNALEWIYNPDRYKTIVENNVVYAVDKDYYPLVTNMMCGAFKFLSFGVPVATVITGKSSSLIPHHALALSEELKRDAFPIVNVDYKTALAFLRREAIVLQGVEKGYVCVAFNNVPLGFVKNVGNRCNNLYPDYWRIRMNVTDTEYKRII